MKITSIFLFLFGFNQILAQDFSTNFIAESLLKSDTITIGFDSTATTLIDLVFGEKDINGIRFDSILEIRSGQISINEIDCGSSNLDLKPNLVTLMSKTDIVPGSCSGLIASQTTNGLAPFYTILVKNENLPITLRWNSADFSNNCLDGSILTDWHPGGWFDASCPILTVPPMELNKTNGLRIIEPSGIIIIDEFGDSISMFFVALGSQGFLDNTSDINIDAFKIFPNPTQGELNIQSDNIDINSIAILNSTGRELIANSKENVINLEELANGLYYIRIETDKGAVVRRVAKYGQ